MASNEISSTQSTSVIQPSDIRTDIRTGGQTPADRSRSLKSLPKEVLLERTRDLAAEERRVGLELLGHLQEIDRRRLPEQMGFSGVFDYCVKALKFSEGSAYRRVQAMRALAQSPDLEKSLQDGRLNLTTASTVQCFLQRARRAGISSREIQKRLRADSESTLESPPSLHPSSTIFSAFQNLSRRDVEKKLSELAPELPRVEREREISGSEVEIRVTLSRVTRAKWTRIQQLAAHRLRYDTSTRRVIELTADVALDTLEKEKGLKTSPFSRSEVKSEAKTEKTEKSENEGGGGSARIPKMTVPPPGTGRSRFIPTAVRRFVWRRDLGRCAYCDASTGIRCESRFGLEIDHIVPWSRGGSSIHAENLRLLCSAHHRLVTEEIFGRRPG
jgi:hypothetical protein